MSLRRLLLQRAARLQEWTALEAPGWGRLAYPAFRSRVEGVALGLMAQEPPVGTPFHCRTGSPWDWISEVACACCGLRWEPGAPPVPPETLGGPLFNHERGRQPFHDREDGVEEGTPFTASLDQGEVLRRLRRLNGRLGWDQETCLTLPLADLGTPEARAALWSALYGGSRVVLAEGRAPAWDPAPFKGFWADPPLSS